MGDSKDKLVHIFGKKNDEQIQIFLNEYGGKYYVDIRVWFLPKDSREYKPTRRGVRFPVEQMPEFREGIEKLGEETRTIKQAGEKDTIQAREAKSSRDISKEEEVKL